MRRSQRIAPAIRVSSVYRRSSTFVLLICCAVTTSAQPAMSIRKLSDQQISPSTDGVAHYESHLAIDPDDPRHMLAMATVQRTTTKLNDDGKWSNSGSIVYVTFDRGRSWTRSAVRDRAVVAGGDGTVYFDRGGRHAYVVVGTRIDGVSRTVIDRSTDAGRTFERLAALPYRDRPWMAFDTSGADGRGTFDGAIYLVGQRNGMVVSRSTDDGATWTFADHIRRDEGGPDPSVTIAGIPGDMLVTNDGDVAITYATARALPDRVGSSGTDTIATSRLDFLVSDDGGRRWRAVRRGPLMHDVRDYRATLSLQAVRSVIDASWSRWRGRIYSVWPEYDERLDRYVVQLAHTDDVGSSWTTTVVSDSSMHGPPANIAVAVNRDGMVAVTWYDRRDDPAHRCWRLYAAISGDGGEHFSANQQLSSSATCVNLASNWMLTAQPLLDTWTDPRDPRPSFMVAALVPVRFPNGGETQGLQADRDGVFHSVWIGDGRGGSLELWHTSFAPVDSLVGRPRRRKGAGTGERTDLSLDLRVEVSAPSIDFARGLLQVSIRVVNPTARDMDGPIDVVVLELTTRREKGMGLKRLRVVGADNGKGGDGASWRFLAPAGRLASGSRTPVRTLRFSFEPGIPDEPKGYFMPRLAIYGEFDQNESQSDRRGP